MNHYSEHMKGIPCSRITSLRAKHVRMPLKEQFETAKRSATSSDAVIVELTTENGITGFGEATPVKYVTGETVESVISAVNDAEHVISGQDVRLAPELSLNLKATLPDSPGARAAIEMSMLDTTGRLSGKPSYELFGGSPRSLETDITIPIVPFEHAGELAAMASAKGFRQFKVKVGCGNADEDLARAEAISRAVPECSLVVDANQGFTPEEAVSFIGRLKRTGAAIAIFEQPVDRYDIEGIAYVTQNVDVPVFADESACSVGDVDMLGKSRSVSGINIKLMKSGIFEAMEMLVRCRTLGLSSMLGCMIEPRVGITAAVHLACIFDNLCHFDLDADLLLAGECSGGFVREGAFVSPVKAPGLDNGYKE
ncbi:MAG: dipeptide epimerase [Armatimonadota bacterium]